MLGEEKTTIEQLDKKFKNLTEEFESYQYFVNKKIGRESGYISINNVPAARNYDAVVDVNGKGDFRTIQEAIDATRKNIFLRRGTHILTSDLVLTNGISIYGEDKFNTIIDLNENYKIKVIGGTQYSTGTIDVIRNSKTVTITSGVTTSLSAGDYMVFNGNSYVIESIVDSTHLTIATEYEGRTEGSLPFHAGAFFSNIRLNNFKVTGQDVSAFGEAIEVYGVVESRFSDIIIEYNDESYTTGLEFKYCFNNNISNIDLTNNRIGIYTNYSNDNSFNSINSNNNSNMGILMHNSNDNTFNDCQLISNGDTGIRLENSNKNLFNLIKINNTFLNAGIHLYASDSNIISNSTIKNNGEEGVRIDSSSYNIISDNLIRDNGQKTNNVYSEILLDDADEAPYATYNVFSNNIIISSRTNKAKYGYEEYSVNDNYNILTGNIIQGAVTATTSVNGANDVVANNIS